MAWNPRRGLAASLLVAIVGFSTLLGVGATPAAAASPCAGAPDAIALSLVIDLEPGQNLTLQGSGGPPFATTAHVTATCTIDNSPVSGATVRVFASDTPGIDVTTQNGGQIGAVIPPGMSFSVNGSAASGLSFADVTTNASGVANFTISSPSANPAAVAGPVLIGSHREQVRQAFGVTLTDTSGTFIGANTGGFLFAQAVPELDSFILFGAGGLALAGFVLVRRQALVSH